MECEAPMTARKIISYKDIVVGPNDPHQSPKSIDLDDVDIELLEDDITFGSMNGIPTIEFSERVLNLAIKSMDLTLVVKVLASPSRLMAWIRLLGLPLTLYKRNFIEAIGSQVGSVIKINFQFDNGCRGHFTRMAVSLNLHQPLVSKLIINGRPKIVEYESLPTVCFHCGIYGHLHDICPKLQYQDVDPHVSDKVLGITPAPSNSIPDEAYGYWMLVEKGNAIYEIIPESREFVPAPIVAPLLQSVDPTIPVDSTSDIPTPSRQIIEKSKA
ncbi:hypothetical protein GQ457_14G019120 [Hibiscus cannabinus]